MSSKARRRLVAIDTNTLAWGIRRKGDADSVKRAKWLFNELQEQNAIITVPAVVMAEFLIPVPQEDRKATATAITRHFNIIPFDARCVELAARLFVDGKKQRKMGEQDARKCLRADTMIVASVKVAQVEVFYTHDADCRKLAKRAGLNAQDLPTMGSLLFSDLEAEDGTSLALPAATKLPLGEDLGDPKEQAKALPAPKGMV